MRSRYSWTSALVLILIVFLLAYLGATFYLKQKAENTLNDVIASLKQEYPQLQSITYESVDISPISLLTRHYVVQKVTITPQNPLYQVTVEKVDLKDMTFGSNHIPSEFLITLDNIRAPNIEDKLESLTSSNGSINPYLARELQATHVSLALNYQKKHKTLTVAALIMHRQEVWAKENIQIKNFLLNSPLNTSGFSQALPLLLKQAYIANIDSEMNIHINPNTKNLSEQSPLLSNLALLGYSTLDITLTEKGSYSSQTRLSTNEFVNTLAGAGTLTISDKEIHPQIMTLAQIVHLFSGDASANTLNPPLLSSLQVQYQDHGLFLKLLTAYAKQVSTPPAQLQMELATLVTIGSSSQHVDRINQAAMSLAQFIQNPTTLTLTLAPAKPVNVQALVQQYQNTLNQPLQNTANMTDQEQKQALADRNNQATQALLDTLNFSITNS